MNRDRAIPRQVVIVEIDLINGKTYTGKVFIDLQSRLLDFVNIEEQFFVFIDTQDEGDDIVRLINKKHIIEVRPIKEPEKD